MHFAASYSLFVQPSEIYMQTVIDHGPQPARTRGPGGRRAVGDGCNLVSIVNAVRAFERISADITKTFAF